MALAVYVHIPYCLQRCRYCDFTTFEQHQIMPPEEYVALVLKEIRQRHQGFQERLLSSIYFGGGTPSLIPAPLIVSILQELANVGFERTPDCEVTIEINPATMDQDKLQTYMAHGVNRFSVGAQTFNDALLQSCGRKHSAADTRETLSLLASKELNYSFDLLFALPGQSLAQVEQDVKEALSFSPQHLSAYCLTVPEGHPMSFGRAPEDEQVAMFGLIESELKAAGILKYEISNFARPGFESQHNLAYWSDRPYWGLGLSAHSYDPRPDWGVRYWNPTQFPQYQAQVEGPSRLSAAAYEYLPAAQKEQLEAHEALTDFSHMFLRTRQGLDPERLRNKFREFAPLALEKLHNLEQQSWLQRGSEAFTLSSRGELLCNFVLRELTFSKQDLVAYHDAPCAPL